MVYYLIHSLLLGRRGFEDADIQAAINFREAAERNGVKRIIYLGGLGEAHTHLSKHLKSRIRVAEELSVGKVRVTFLEFNITPWEEYYNLSVFGHFDPHGLFGKIYWYFFLPFHRFIFNDLLKELERKS